jgi:hypothetical protein
MPVLSITYDGTRVGLTRIQINEVAISADE